MPLNFDDNKLTTDWGGSIVWNEIASIHATKFDSLERLVTIVTFNYANGEFIEINTDEPGFDNIRRKLADYLPLSNDWYTQIEALPPSKTLTFFDRRRTE